MLAVLFGAATKMTDDLSVGVKRGNRDVCKQGRIPGAPPIGYVKVRDRAGFRGAGKVMPDPGRFPLVKRLWEDIASGTVTATDAWLRAVDAGLTTRATAGHASAPVKLTHVFVLLKNRFYTGSFRHGGELYEGEHEPMITMAQYDRVQQLLGRVDAPRPSKHGFLFRGLLRCADCGGERAMVGEEHVTTAGNRLVYYRCGRRRPGYAVCRSRPIAEQAIVRAAEESLRNVAIPPALARWTIEAVDWWIENHRNEDVATAAAVERQVREAEAKLARLTDLVISGALSETDYCERKEELQVTLADLRARAADPEADNTRWRDVVAELVTTATSCASAFSTDDLDARRAVLAKVYANLDVQAGIPRFSLAAPYFALADAPVVHASFRDGDANLPTPEECWTHSKKAARRSRLAAAFSLWCTRLEEVRTGTQIASPHRPAGSREE